MIANLASSHQKIHQEALAIANKYKRSEIELIEVLCRVDKFKIYYKYGYNSLYKYTTDALGLSESVAYNFINVVRKSHEVPALKEEIQKGHLSVSKAKKITSVINKENHSHWIQLAKSQSQKKIEREVAIHSPKEAVRELIQYVPENKEIKDKVKLLKLDNPNENKPVVRVQLQAGVSEKLMLRIRRVQDILSQKKKKSVSLEEALEVLTNLYIQKHDPLEKAKRQQMRGKLNESNLQVSRPVNVAAASKKKRKRRSIKPITRHKLYLNHEGRCTHIDNSDKRCQETRFLEIHHILPVAKGGGNHISNLTLLCNGHHRAIHLNE